MKCATQSANSTSLVYDNVLPGRLEAIESFAATCTSIHNGRLPDESFDSAIAHCLNNAFNLLLVAKTEGILDRLAHKQFRIRSNISTGSTHRRLPQLSFVSSVFFARGSRTNRKYVRLQLNVAQDDLVITEAIVCGCFAFVKRNTNLHASRSTLSRNLKGIFSDVAYYEMSTRQSILAVSYSG